MAGDLWTCGPVRLVLGYGLLMYDCGVVFAGQEPHVIRRYVREMNKVEAMIRKKLIWRGLVSSTAQAIPIFGYGVTLYYGGLMVANEEIHFKNIIK